MSINAGTVMAYMDMDMSGYNSALQSAQSQADAFAANGGGISGMLDGWGASMTAAGTALTLGVTAPLVGLGTAAVGIGMTFDASMSNVAALSGTTGEKFDELRAKALEMGSTTKYTASQAADAMGYMALAGWNADQMMAGLPGVLSLAAAANMDLARASDIVTDTMTPFGLAASQAGRVSDVFAKTQATSNTNVEQLGEAMKYAASNADAFGMSIEQTSAVIGLFANSGIKGSMAGTTMTAMLTDMKNAMVDGAIAIGKTNISLVDAQGNYREFPDIFADIEAATYGMSESERDAALASVFQTRGMKGMLALLKQGSGALYEYTDALEDSNGAADEMATIMQDNLKGDLTIFRSGVEGAAIALSDYLVPWLRKGVQWLTSAVTWFNELDPAIKNTAFRIGTIAAAIGPALLVGGKLISGFSGVLPVLGLLAGGFALVYNHSEKLQGFVQSIRDSIPEWMDGLKDGYETFRVAMADGQGVIIAAEDGLEAAFGPKAAANIGRALRAVQSGFRAAKGAVTDVMSGVGEFIGSLIDGEGAAETLRQTLETTFGQEFALRASGAIGWIDTVFSAVERTALTFAQGARETFATLWDGIAADYETGGLMGVVSGLGGRLGELLASGAEAAKAGAVTVRDKIAEGFSMAREWLAPKAQTWMSNLGQAYQDAKGYATEKLPTVKSDILDALTSTKEAVTTKAQSVMQWLGEAYRSEAVQEKLGDLSGVGSSIWEKIKMAKTTLVEKAGEWLNNLGTVLGSDEAKAKVTEITGVAATIAEKIVSGIGTWKTTAATLIGDLITQLTDSGFLETTITGLGGIVTAIAKGIGNAAENITGCAADLITKLSDKFAETGFIERVFTTGADIVLSIAGALAKAAGNMATAASKLALGLINGFAALDWNNIFSRAGEIVGSIAKVLSENAGTIGTAALDLGLKLLEGLAGVDWATISYNLAVALGNLITAISEWFAVPENTGKLLKAGAEIAAGIFKGFSQRFYEINEIMFPGAITWQQFQENPPVLIDPAIKLDDASLNKSVTETEQNINTAVNGIKITNGMPDLGIDPNIFTDQNAFTETAQSAVDTTTQTLNDGKGAVKESSQGVTDAIKQPFEGLPEETKAQAALMLTSVNAAIEEGTPEAVAAIDLAAGAVFDRAKEILSSPAGIAVGSVFMIGIMTGALSIQGALVSAIQGVGTLGVNAIASVMNSGTGYGIGRSMVQAVISGAGSMASALAGMMYSLGASAVSAFKSAIRMASPPAAFVEIGEAIPGAVGIGTDNNRDAAIHPMIDMARDMQNAFNVSLGDENATAKAHNTGGGGSQNDGSGNSFIFHFHGDMTVRDDSDIKRISQQVYEEIQDALRGGGALA